MLIHRLTYRRNGHDNLHVRGYIENGTTSTPFDMVVMNQVDRYSLAMDVIDRVPHLPSRVRISGRNLKTSWWNTSITSTKSVMTCRKSKTGSGRTKL